MAFNYQNGMLAELKSIRSKIDLYDANLDNIFVKNNGNLEPDKSDVKKVNDMVKDVVGGLLSKGLLDKLKAMLQEHEKLAVEKGFLKSEQVGKKETLYGQVREACDEFEKGLRAITSARHRKYIDAQLNTIEAKIKRLNPI